MNPKTVAIEALGQLIYEQPARDHFDDFMAETNADKNDRGAAILLAANVENALDGVLLRFLKNHHRALFSANGPLGPAPIG
jgi:hypothetical protein